MELESRPDPIIDRELMDQLRDIATARESDTIAVIVLAGTKERGLGFSVSSVHDSEEETFELFAHVLTQEAVAKGWVSDS